MSVQIQLQKCKSVYCNNTVHPGIKKEHKQFCRACLNNKTGILSWRCANPKCNGVVTSHLLYKKYCSKRCKDQVDQPGRRKRAREAYRRKYQSHCGRCGGRIQDRKRARKYCTPYCKFLNKIKHKNQRNYERIMKLVMV